MDLKSHCTAVEQLCECSFSPELCQVHTHVYKYLSKQIFSLCPSYQVHMTQLQMFKQVNAKPIVIIIIPQIPGGTVFSLGAMVAVT